MDSYPIDPAIQLKMPSSTRTFVDVTVVDFALMEATALKNKARVIFQEGVKLREGTQGIWQTACGVLDTLLESTEHYYDFPPQGHFHIERGH